MKNVILGQGKRYTDEEHIIINSEDFLFKCSQCGETKSNKEFSKRSLLGKSNINKGRGFTNVCKCCENINKKKTYKKEDSKLFYARKNFNISPSEYYQMKENQNYCCAICGVHEDMLTKCLSLDHNHKTGDVRGFLCHGCNVGIGHLKDNVKILEKAIEYLNNNGVLKPLETEII